MKLLTPRRRRWILILAAPLLPLIVLAVRNPGNRAQTSPDSEDEQLRTRRYAHGLANVHGVLLALIPELRTYGQNWKMVETAPHELKVEVPVLFFTDDLTVTLREDADGVLVDAVSQSRVGRGDFGENRRHIRQLLNALDKRL